MRAVLFLLHLPTEALLTTHSVIVRSGWSTAVQYVRLGLAILTPDRKRGGQIQIQVRSVDSDDDS